MDEILAMREEYKEFAGDQFFLAGFHEDLLKVGNMPPALMRKGLMTEKFDLPLEEQESARDGR